VSKEDSIMKNENRFGSFGMGKSVTIYMLLYPNRWAFSIKIRDSGNWWYIEIIKGSAIVVISPKTELNLVNFVKHVLP